MEPVFAPFWAVMGFAHSTRGSRVKNEPKIHQNRAKMTEKWPKNPPIQRNWTYILISWRLEILGLKILKIGLHFWKKCQKHAIRLFLDFFEIRQKCSKNGPENAEKRVFVRFMARFVRFVRFFMILNHHQVLENRPKIHFKATKRLNWGKIDQILATKNGFGEKNRDFALFLHDFV